MSRRMMSSPRDVDVDASRSRGFVLLFTRCNKNAKPHESSHSRAVAAFRLDRGRDATRSRRDVSRCASRSSHANAIARARGEGDVRVAAAGGILERRGERERARERARDDARRGNRRDGDARCGRTRGGGHRRARARHDVPETHARVGRLGGRVDDGAMLRDTSR